MIVHRFVHRGCDDDRHVRTEGGRRRRRDGCVVDRAGDLADRVGRRGRDQQHVGPALAATEIDVFDAAGDLGDNVALGGVFEGPGVDDPACAVGHQRADRGPLSAEFVGEFDGFHRGDASRDAEGDVDSVEHSVGPEARRTDRRSGLPPVSGRHRPHANRTFITDGDVRLSQWPRPPIRNSPTGSSSSTATTTATRSASSPSSTPTRSGHCTSTTTTSTSSMRISPRTIAPSPTSYRSTPRRPSGSTICRPT